jgi:hypothetical protein
MSAMTPEPVVTAETVTATIDAFTSMDEAGDKGAMTALARRLGKDQPALLQFAAAVRIEHTDALGEAMIFYSTLVWSMFERQFGKQLPRLIPDNIKAAEQIVADELAAVEGIGDRPVHERVAPGVAERQPHVVARLQELVAEDVKEDSFSADDAAILFTPFQVVVEAFDAAVTGRRPGQSLAPVVRAEPKVGRNDPCPCGSGKKYKRCHGAAAA